MAARERIRERTSSRGRDDDDRRSTSRDRDRDDDRGSRGGSSRDRDDRGSSRGRDRDERTSSRDRGRDDDRRGSGERLSRGGGKSTKWNTHRNPDAVKARTEQTGGRFDSYLIQGVDMYKPKDGDNTIRFLPPRWDAPVHYGYDIWVHGYVGADSSTYLCLDKMKKEPCPICEAAAAAKADGDSDEAKDLQPSHRVAFYILDRDDEAKAHPMIYTTSWSQDRDITALCFNKRTGKTLYIDDEEEGYDFSFRRAGKGLKTRYFGMQIDRDPSPISTDRKEQQEVLQLIEDTPIPAALKYYDYDYLDKVISGTAPQRDELDEPEDDRRGGGRSRDRDDDRDNDRGRGRGDPEDEVEEPEDEPRRGRGRDRDEPEERRPASRERTRVDDTRGRGRSRDEEEEPEAEDRLAGRRSTRNRDDDDRGSRGRGRDDRDEPESEELEEPEEEDERPARRGGGRR